jgi:integrase
MVDTKIVMADKCFEKWQDSIKGKINTQLKYKYGILKYCEHTGKEPTTLINEAKEDYINRVTPWELRHVNALESFVSSFKNDTTISNWTKLGWINSVKNFYAFHKIPIPEINKTGIDSSATEEYRDIPVLKLEDIRKGVNICGDNLLLKALILTFLSSGQGQAEIQKLKGKHLKNVVNGIAVVNMTRGKTNNRYTFFIGSEALDAIKEYKPGLKDEDFIFTQASRDRPINDSYVGTMFARHAEKLGFDRGYFAPHRYRHFFKTSLTGLVDSLFIEFWMGHKPKGTDANYFLGTSIQGRMLDAYTKNLDKLTVFTDKEVLQKQYDELKGKVDIEKEELKARLDNIEKTMEDMMKKRIEGRMKELKKD